MAVISEYEEEEPVQTSKAQAEVEVQEIRLTPGVVTPPDGAPGSGFQVDTQHDAVLNTLLEEHDQQPLELLTTVIDYLFRETDLSQQDGVEVKVSEIVGAARKRRRKADAESAAAEKMAKVDKDVKEKDVFVDLNKAPVDEDVEEVNITSSPVSHPVVEPEPEPEPEPEVADVKENIEPGKDDYDEEIDGKGLSTLSFLSVSFVIDLLDS